MRNIAFFFILLTFFSLEAENISVDYENHPVKTHPCWPQIEPFLLPEDHPIKQKLDTLFLTSRVVSNGKSLYEAGFENVLIRQFSHIVVTRHSGIKGFFFKLFRDDQNLRVNCERLLMRVRGAKSLQETINQLGYQNFFKVPCKWIYPIPFDPAISSRNPRNLYLLVAEDADIYSFSRSKAIWRSSAVTTKLLEAFYVILQKEGLSDSTQNINAPFSKDGRIAFIDLEFNHCWPIHFSQVLKLLSKPKQNHWQQLIVNGGPISQQL